MSTTTTPVLQGVVAYTLHKPSETDTYKDELHARWLSSRIVSSFKEAGTGHAVRRQRQPEQQVQEDGMASVEKLAEEESGWEGNWEIRYFEPDGKLALHGFGLRVWREGDVSFFSI